MSYEAWGTPPDPEPRYCPLCDQESHTAECELGKMQASAFLAEAQRDELLARVAELEAVLAECRNVMQFINHLDDDRDFLDQPEYEQLHKAIAKIDEVLKK